MQPYKIEIYIYAESEQEAREVQQAAYDFVNENYQRGGLVTASKLKDLLISENTNPQEPRQPRNLFEQILFGVQVTNDNIVTLHDRVDAFEAKINAIYDALYPTSEPNASGADEKIETVGGKTK